MKNLKIILALFAITLYSCDKEDGSIKDDTALFTPMPMVLIGDMVIHLQWSDAVFIEFKNISNQEIIKPDVLEFFVSDEPNGDRARSVREVNFNEKKCTLDGFVNGKPFFIYLLAKKKGYGTQKSEMVMVVPNKRKEYKCILEGTERQYFWDLAVSPDGTKIAYVDNYVWGNGNYAVISLFTANIDGTDVQMIAKSSYNPSWSPDGTKIAFQTEEGEINVGNGFPSQIAIYDCNTNIISKLTSDTYHNYHPSFSDDGNFLAYQSDEDLLNLGNTSNIITLNLQTLSKKQCSTDRRNYEFPIYFSDYFLFSGQSPYSSRSIIGIHSEFDTENFITSYKNDFRPSLSPDKKRVAFISDRSGIQQVWVYEIETGNFLQVTGYDENESIYNYAWTKINWIDNITLVFTLSNNKVLRQRI